MQRIGLLGGTFDPPHIAHLVLADCAIESLGLDDLYFIPAADPPHKQGDTRQPAEHRLRMLERALSIDPRFKLSLVDMSVRGRTTVSIQCEFSDNSILMLNCTL